MSLFDRITICITHRIIISFFAGLLISGFCKPCAAQDTLPQKKNSIIGYPLAFYLPETGLGIGAAVSYNFYISKRDSISPPSQVQMGLAYTQNDQILLYFPFQLFWKNRRHTLSGELGYYDYTYYFFGTGNPMPDNIKELYSVKFPRFRINYLRRFKEHFYAGARWWYEQWDITGTKPDGELEKGIVPGSNGSITSGPGLVLMFDNRDNIYYTLKGSYLELVYHNQAAVWGSNFYYDRYRIEGRHYFPTGKNQCLAVDAFGDFITGNVPFNQMANIGSSKRMRGYYEGRYRDKNMLMLQAEYRIMPFRRWGLAAFAGYSVLSPEVSNFSLNNGKYSAGLGLRFAFDPAKKMNLRLDYAIGQNTNGLYFTIGEAF